MKVINPVFYDVSPAGLTAITEYLNTSGSFIVPLADIELDATNWTNILTATTGSGGVTLDLTGCAVAGGVFNPGTVSVLAAAIDGIILPSAANRIETSATSVFDHFPNLKTVTALNVTVIGDNAFDQVASLTTVNIPKAMSIGKRAFAGTATTDAIFPNLNSTIDEYAFADCSSLVTVDISGATAINQNTFQNCSSLTEVTLTSVETIGEDAFTNCGSLATVTIGGGITGIGPNAFNGCNLTTVTFETGNVLTAGDFGTNAFPDQAVLITVYNGAGTYEYDSSSSPSWTKS
jgi:hypothetical protein